MSQVASHTMLGSTKKRGFFASIFSPEPFHYEDLKRHVTEVSRQEFLRQYLPYLEILSDQKTVLTKNHTLVRVFKITGSDSSNLSPEDKSDLSNIRNNFFSLVKTDVNLTFYTLRRQACQFDRAEKLFTNHHADQISKTWDEQFKNSYVNNIYLVVSKNFSTLGKDSSQFFTKLNAARKEFDFYCSQLKSLLTKFVAVDVDNRQHELFRFFSYLVNGCEFASKGTSDLFNFLSLSDISFNTSSGLVKIKNDKVSKFAKIIGVRVSSNYSDENLSKILLTLSHEFTLVQQVKTYTKEKNRKFFVEKRKSLEQLPQLAAIQTRIEELSTAAELIESNQTNFLDYSCYIKVFAPSPEKLDDAVAEIQNVLAQEGVSSVTETIGVMLAFFATLPDMESILSKLQTSIRSRITTQNVSDFISLSANKEGFKRSPFGESSVCDFRAISTSSLVASHSGNYGFTFHQDDISDRSPGHTMIIGQTGTGKSTLAAFLLMNCLKFEDIKILCFDSLQGLKLTITAFDGKYTTVGKDVDLKLNPMKLPDSFANRNFLKRFIEMIAGGIEENEHDIVDEVLRQNYEVLDEEERSLCNLRLAFGREGIDEVSKRLAIASRLKQWMGSGDGDKNEIYAKFFNNAQDNLDFNSSLVAFDMGEVIKDPKLLSPTAFYIFHKFNQLIEENPSPHIFFIDEMQKYLQSKDFNPHIISTIKESRKRNGIFIGCMQEASTLVESENGDEIISNLATLIIFPNSKARPEHYITGLNLTEAEFDFIKNHPNPRHVLVKKKGGHSVVIDADLSLLGKHLKLFSSKDTDRKLMEKLIAQETEIAQSEEGKGALNSWVDEFLAEVH